MEEVNKGNYKEVTKEENCEADDPRQFYIEMINKYNKED